MPPVFRFAPTPNGPLHLGHAHSALLNFDLARRGGGAFLLRIEDIDATRCRPEFETAIREDLTWLGISWDGPVRRQSEHFQTYSDAIARLVREGLVYPSVESRAEIAQRVATHEAVNPWPRDPDGVPLYPGSARDVPMAQREQIIASGAAHALRLDMPAALARVGGELSWIELGGARGRNRKGGRASRRLGRCGAGRKETPTSYHLPVVIDDAVQGVTDVVRGRDLFWLNQVHRLLQHLLDLPAPRGLNHVWRRRHGRRECRSRPRRGRCRLDRDGPFRRRIPATWA